MSTDPAQEFAAWFADEFYPQEQEQQSDVVVPAEPTSRLPAPNHNQGTSGGGVDLPDPMEAFAEMLSVAARGPDPNQFPGGARRMSAAEVGQHAGWSTVRR